MKVQWRSGSAPFLYVPDRVDMSHNLSDADVVGSTPTWTMFFVLLRCDSVLYYICRRAHKRIKFYEGAPIK